MSKELTEFESDPYSLFIFALNSPSTKQKCVPRLKQIPQIYQSEWNDARKKFNLCKKCKGATVLGWGPNKI